MVCRAKYHSSFAVLYARAKTLNALRFLQLIVSILTFEAKTHFVHIDMN